MKTMRHFISICLIFFVLLCMLAGPSVRISYAQGVALDVRIRDASLSVDAHQAELGRIIDEISKQADFELSMSPELRSRKLSVTFKEVDIEKGIRRLLSLADLKSFIVEYAQDGSVNKLRVFKRSSAVAVAPNWTQQRPAFRGQGTASPRYAPSRMVPARRQAVPSPANMRTAPASDTLRRPLSRQTGVSPGTSRVVSPKSNPTPLEQDDDQDQEPSPLMPKGNTEEPPPLMPEGDLGEPPPFMPEGTQEEPPPFIP
jgi:hypothetical protein